MAGLRRPSGNGDGDGAVDYDEESSGDAEFGRLVLFGGPSLDVEEGIM